MKGDKNESQRGVRLLFPTQTRRQLSQRPGAASEAKRLWDLFGRTEASRDQKPRGSAWPRGSPSGGAHDPRPRGESREPGCRGSSVQGGGKPDLIGK